MQSGIDGKRIAALIGDGFEEAELTEPRRVLEEAGAIVTIVGLDDKAKAKIRSRRGPDDGVGTGAKAEEVVADCTAEDFDGLLIPGGYSPDRIRANREVQRFVKEFDTAKKPMFAIGHGAHVLISAQVARGRTMTGSPSISDDIRNAGGLFRDQPTVQDGHWITTRGVGDMILFNRAMVEKLSASANQPV
ncbi:MAG: type 1 glutamine amidotransferase domain-containing protein [Vulcanimicrobiaceae bacterium]